MLVIEPDLFAENFHLFQSKLFCDSGSNISEIGEIADATSQLDGSGSQSGR